MVSHRDPSSQKRVRRSFGSYEEALSYRNNVSHRLAKGELANGNRYVGHLLQIYLDTNPRSTMTQRKNSFISFCESFNSFEVHQLSHEALGLWFESLREKMGYTNKTLHCIKILMNGFFKWLVAEGYLDSNPLDRIKYRVHKSLQRARVIMTEAELKDMLGKLQGFRSWVYQVVYALVHTGARKNEIRLLTWGQVDFATGYIQLHKTKNGEDRLIKMSENLAKMLESLPRTDRHVFLNPKGFCVSAWQVDDGIAALQEKYTDMKRWRCHDLRHSFAYNFLKKGGQLYQLQAILGHKNITMTVDFYGNLKATDIEKPSPFDF